MNEDQINKIVDERIKDALKNKLEIAVDNWQFHSEVKIKYDGEVITSARIDT